MSIAMVPISGPIDRVLSIPLYEFESEVAWSTLLFVFAFINPDNYPPPSAAIVSGVACDPVYAGVLLKSFLHSTGGTPRAQRSVDQTNQSARQSGVS